jgi:hypothetical protein
VATEHNGTNVLQNICAALPHRVFAAGANRQHRLPEQGHDLRHPVLAQRLPAAEDHIPDPQAVDKAISRHGDVWRLDRHRLLCGSALDAAAYDVLMGDEKAQIVSLPTRHTTSASTVM